MPVESQRKFDSNIGICYPVGAYIGNSYHVFYAGTTTDVQQDWVVIGPDNQATQDFIATGIREIESNQQSTANGPVYNLNGQQVANGKLPRGIYIKDGKKILMQ